VLWPMILGALGDQGLKTARDDLETLDLGLTASDAPGLRLAKASRNDRL
jgi:hypothetical protein